MTTFTIRVDHELYVFVRGRLVMKRHIDTGETVLFQTAPSQVVRFE